jgi:hypothetical protein
MMGLMISGLVLNYGHICCLLEQFFCFVFCVSLRCGRSTLIPANENAVPKSCKNVYCVDTR